LYWWKSNSADTTARAWVALATDRLLYLWVNGLAQTDGSYSGLYQFGDLKSYMTGDQFATHIWGDPNSTVWGDCSGVLTAYPNSAAIGHFVCRVHTYAGGSAVSAKFADGTKMNSGEGRLGTNGLSYPNPTDGGLYLSRVWQGRGSVLRGEFPGLWCPLHSFPLAQFDTFTGSGDLAGRTFLALRVGYTSGQGEVFMETSNTWDI
jgi:hypothetical protein